MLSSQWHGQVHLRNRCFLLMHTGNKPMPSKNRCSRLSLADRRQNGIRPRGSVFTAGAVVQWLRDQLGLIKSAPEIERLAKRVPTTAECTLCRRSPAWAHHTGTPTPGPPSADSAVAPATLTSPGRLWRASLSGERCDTRNDSRRRAAAPGAAGGRQRQ